MISVQTKPRPSAPTPVASPSDWELMQRLADGDLRLLEEIYLRYAGMVKAALLRFAPGIPLADIQELSQDVFMALAKTAHRFDANKQLKPWVYGIAVKKAQGFRRSRWLHLQLLRRHYDESAVTRQARQGSPEDSTETRDGVTKAFAKLSAEQREVLILHAVEGFSGDEIAEILRVRPKTVWTRLHRARRKLRESLTIDSDGQLMALGQS